MFVVHGGSGVHQKLKQETLCVQFLANISAEMEVGTYRVFAWIFCFYILCQNLVWLFSFYVSVKNVICLSCFFALV